MSDLYETHPQTCEPDDYWGQVRRTVDGKPIPGEQIDLIVGSMREALELCATDRLLDLCCGNGALTTRWFAECAGGIGVDASKALIDVALADFADPPRATFVRESVFDYAEQLEGSPQAEEFSKSICYGSFQYLRRDRVRLWLSDLRRGLPALQRLVLGNVPDRERVDAFAREGVEIPLDDPTSAIGCWWSREELVELAERAGFRCQTRVPSEAFYAAHYRFDAILEPQGF